MTKAVQSHSRACALCGETMLSGRRLVCGNPASTPQGRRGGLVKGPGHGTPRRDVILRLGVGRAPTMSRLVKAI